MIIHVVLNAAEVSREHKKIEGFVFLCQMDNRKRLLIGRE